MRDSVFVGASASILVAPDVFLLKWTLTCESILMKRSAAYEWSCNVFLLATIESLELLSNSHMVNNLQYAVA